MPCVCAQNNETPAQIAAREGNASVLHVLVRHGADIFLKDQVRSST